MPDGDTARRLAVPCRHPAVLLSVMASVGCYSYVAAPPNDRGIPAGAEIRVELTPVGASRFAGLLGPRAVRVDGRLAASGSDTGVTLVPGSILSMDGTRTAWAGDAPLSLPADAIASVRRRQFSPRRTLVAAGSATTAALVIGVAAARRRDKGGGTGTPPPPPPP